MRLKRWMVSLIALSLPLVKLNHHWFTYIDHLLAPSSAFERPPSKSLKVKGGAMLEYHSNAPLLRIFRPSFVHNHGF